MNNSSILITATIVSWLGVVGGFSAPASDRDFSGRLEITNGSASFVVVGTGPNGRTIQVCHKVGEVLPTSIVSTNLNGLWLILSTSTNSYQRENPMLCKVFVCNATSVTVNLHSVHAPEATTGFGQFLVTRTETGIALPRAEQPFSRFGYGGGGSFGPGDFRDFEFNLGSLFDLGEPGRYRISFRGKLPSVEHPDVKIEFETPPLLITVEPPKSKETNVPPHGVVAPK